MLDLNVLRDDDSGEVFMALTAPERSSREVLIACMPNVHDWPDSARDEYTRRIQNGFSKDKTFFRELLTNDMNDSSPLLYADESVQTDEEMLFLAMEADESFGRMANAFSIFASSDQKHDASLVKRLLNRFPNAAEFL
jgi:hypothetical protein